MSTAGAPGVRIQGITESVIRDSPKDLAGYMDGCQRHGPLLSPLKIRCRAILRTQKETRILTTSHMHEAGGLCIFILMPNNAG